MARRWDQAPGKLRPLRNLKEDKTLGERQENLCCGHCNLTLNLIAAYERHLQTKREPRLHTALRSGRHYVSLLMPAATLRL
jgi:hypothetical protein